MANGEHYLWNIVEELSKKDGVTEIVINGPGDIFVEKNCTFYHVKNEAMVEDISAFIREIATFNGRECNETMPILDGSMPDGSRVNIIHAPYANKSSAVTIRRYSKNIKTFDGDESLFGLGSKWILFFKALIESEVNIVVSGGTGVGKTTFLNLLIKELSPQVRLITIEDTIELDIGLPNCVRLEGSSSKASRLGDITHRDLVKNALRMRPDRIVLGEIRGGELFDLLQAMNTGHRGVLTSIHSNSPNEVFSRMENLYYFVGNNLPVKVVRAQMSSGIDFVVHLTKTKDGVRVVSEISEVTGMEGDTILTGPIALWDGEKLASTGLVPQCWSRVVENSSLVALDFFN